MSRVEVTTRDIPRPRWSARYAAFLRKAMTMIGQEEGEVSVLLCGDGFIRALSAKYRGKDSATDVLSFRQADGAGPGAGSAAGDIVISLEALRRNAAALGVTPDDELKRLGVHGLLHLSGMDHGSGRGGAMLARQEEILVKLGRARIIAPGSRR